MRGLGENYARVFVFRRIHAAKTMRGTMRNHFLKNLFGGAAGREQELLKTVVFTSNLEPWLLKAVIFTSISEPRLPKTNVFTTTTGLPTVTFTCPSQSKRYFLPRPQGYRP